jgi:hypothetical protein
MLRRPPRILLLAIALFAPATASATVVRSLTLAEKVAVSPLIVHARVERTETIWDVPGASVQTFVVLRVIESLRGDAGPGSRVTVRQLGGVIGDFHQEVAGTSAFEPGEEVIVFLEPNGAEYVEIGIGIAKYTIDTSGGAKLVSHAPDVAGARFEGGRLVKIAPIAPMAPEPLDRFLAAVRAYAKAVGR